MKKRVRGIEPPCAAWEAAVLPLNYTREEIFDFRFPIADCNRNKFALSASHAEVRLKTADAAARMDGDVLNNHCHEITSSAAVKFVVPLLRIPYQRTRRLLRCRRDGPPRHVYGLGLTCIIVMPSILTP